MKCVHCQERLATLSFTHFVNGKKVVQSLCHTCAVSKGLMTKNEKNPLHDLLSDLLKYNSDRQSKYQEIKQVTQCKTCQMTYQKFMKNYKLGCVDCYDVFSDHILPVLKRVHNGNTVHTGKVPKTEHEYVSKQKQINGYREQLKVLIEEERFEEAAKVRDAIRALEQNKKDTKGGDDHVT